jgi:hypothetical protein
LRSVDIPMKFYFSREAPIGCGSVELATRLMKGYVLAKVAYKPLGTLVSRDKKVIFLHLSLESPSILPLSVDCFSAVLL